MCLCARHGIHGWAAFLIVLAVLSAGCAELRGPEPTSAGVPESAAVQPLVVALIDTGINPYHSAFSYPDSADVTTFVAGIGARSVRLSNHTAFDEAVAEDAQTWDSMKLGTLVHFEGTRVLAISFDDRTEDPLILDSDKHGTQTASLVARDAPHALILMIQIYPSICDAGEGCVVTDTVAKALHWAAAQPWIDVISVSIGLPVGTPDPLALHPEGEAYLNASLAAATNGKLLVTAAGNYGAPTITSYFCGPAWVVCVGGTFGSGTSDVAFAGRGVDVAANYTERVASHESGHDYVWSRGTSFATPIVASVCAEVLWHLRLATPSEGAAAGGSLVPPYVARVRAALNLTALTPSPADWTPPVNFSSPTPVTYTNSTVLNVPVLLPGQIGWGHVHAGLIPQMIANLGLPPETDTPRAMVQAEYQKAREEYWARM